MKQKIEEFKKFAKENKVFIGVCTGAAIIGGSLMALALHDKSNAVKIIEDVCEKSIPMDIPKVDVGEITDLWEEGGFTNAIINEVTVDQLGAFSEELKKIKGVTGDTLITGMISFLDEK